MFIPLLSCIKLWLRNMKKEKNTYAAKCKKEKKREASLPSKVRVRKKTHTIRQTEI